MTSYILRKGDQDRMLVSWRTEWNSYKNPRDFPENWSTVILPHSCVTAKWENVQILQRNAIKKHITEHTNKTSPLSCLPGSQWFVIHCGAHPGHAAHQRWRLASAFSCEYVHNLIPGKPEPKEQSENTHEHILSPNLHRTPLKLSLTPLLSPHLKHVPLGANNHSMGTIACFIRILGNGHKSGHCNNGNENMAIGKELLETVH